MGLVEAVAAFETRLTAVLTALADPAQPVPTYRFGADQLAAPGAMPEIVWVPTTGEIDGSIVPAPDTRQVASPTNPTQAATAAILNPRPLRRRRPTVDAHIRCDITDPDRRKDYTACEKLLNHLAAAVHQTIYGAYAVLKEDWNQTQNSGAGPGAKVVLSIEIHVPITREPDTTAVVTAMPVSFQYLPIS
jgi:hypothetical protein